MIKRFYRDVAIAHGDDGWAVELDGRAVKTVNGSAQIVPREPLAELLAAEWRAQGDTLDKALFRFRDHTDYAIDIVRTDRATTIDKLIAFAETDTLCYRAEPEDALYRRQSEVWEPVLTTFEAREGVSFHRISGIMHHEQSSRTLDTLRAQLETFDDFTLSGLQVLASLAASLTIGMTALQPDADAVTLWNVANLEEDWQVEQWGADEDAALLRARRQSEFLTALDFIRAVRK